MDLFFALPEWSVKPAIAAVCLGLIAAFGVVWRRLTPRALPEEVRAAPMVIGCGMLLVVCGLLLVWLGIAQSVQEGTSSTEWLGLILTLLGLGGTILWFQRGAIVTYDDRGVAPRGQVRRSWNGIRVRLATFGPGVVIHFPDRRPLGIAAGSDGLEAFLIRAFEAGVPGAEQLVRRVPESAA
jgi:hypothetical protein